MNLYNFELKKLILFNSNEILPGNNLILVKARNGVVYRLNDFNKTIHPGLKLKISGNNNIILFEDPIYFKNSLINVSSNDNIVIIEQTKRLVMLNLSITDGDRQQIHIKNDFSCGRTQILMHEELSSIFIGQDNMFSADVLVLNSDCHVIFDSDLSRPIDLNISKDIKLGDHVWVGRGVLLLKNAQISDNSIVGAGSVVVSKFIDKNIVISGNPAKVVKKNISWNRASVSKCIRRVYSNEENNFLIDNQSQSNFSSYHSYGINSLKSNNYLDKCNVCIGGGGGYYYK